MRKVYLLAVICLVVGFAAANAAPELGSASQTPLTTADPINSYRELVAMCRFSVAGFDTVSGAHDSAYCLGFANAIVNFSNYLPGVCIPGGVSVGDITKLIVKYGDDHPERLYADRRPEMITALAAAFPCNAKK